ncbi:TPA: hypothetical protein AB5H67_001477 [Vibrio cholerae]|nr:hypothetical protein [Vibrio cholerae]
MIQSRNSRYEEKKKQKGLKKVTLWIPQGMESDFYQLASALADNPSLTIDVLRNIDTGKFVSLHRL